MWMGDYLPHSKSNQENKQVHERSLREGTEYGELTARVLKELKSQRRDRDISRINISRKLLLIPRVGDPKGGDTVTRFQDLGLPSENSFCNSGYLAGAGSWKEKLSRRSWNHRGDAAQNRAGRVGDGRGTVSPPSDFPITHLIAQASWQQSLENEVCVVHSLVVQSRTGKWKGMDSRANKQITGTPSHMHVEMDFRSTCREATSFLRKQCCLCSTT